MEAAAAVGFGQAHLHCRADTSPSLADVIIMIADANRDK